MVAVVVIVVEMKEARTLGGDWLIGCISS